MRISAATLALGLLLAGCEDGAPERQATQVRAANPTSDALKGMTELYRHLGLRRAIVDNGQKCKKVDRGGYQEDYKNMAMWTAHCTDSGDWAIFIAPDGSVQVRRCGNLDRLGLPQCRPAAAAAAKGEAAPR
jgi:hypothetical protein